ncbi:hypothetical protein [Pseudacidovorax intermedius]|uniref:hypothetical protein n=1 Tax=Pseudacidovorax intermedius TaxID=433924 RepID=UPI0026EDBF25|nr:hypothetical protein [Pseudacidovorax intermedius]
MTHSKPLLCDAELAFLIRMEADEAAGFEPGSPAPFAIVGLSEVAARWTILVPFHVPFEVRTALLRAAEAVAEKYGLLPSRTPYKPMEPG